MQVIKWLTDGKPEDALDSSTGGEGERFLDSCVSAVDNNCFNWGDFRVGGRVESDSDSSEDDDSGVGVGRGAGENSGVFSSCKQEMYSWKTETKYSSNFHKNW